MAVSTMVVAVYACVSCITVLSVHAQVPIVVNTWPFSNATSAAWQQLYYNKSSSLEAVVAGCTECEVQQCDGTVGYGGDPDEAGETTLDAMIMDGKTMDVGAVGSIRRIKNAIGVARAVMEHTDHTLLVGELDKIDPQKNVSPDPKKGCGPYVPNTTKLPSDTWYSTLRNKMSNIGMRNHDTIGMLAIDANRNIASGTTTNGLNHKVPGRVGDSPIMGAGSYAMNGAGGAACTGNGDIMMRFLPSYNAVSMMGRGVDPNTAAAKALQPIIKFYPSFRGAIITVNKDGVYGAACYGFAMFQYSVANLRKPVTTEYKDCIPSS